MLAYSSEHLCRKVRVSMNTNPGRIDKYELQEPLGQGEMTEVWKAFDIQSRRYVAIKFLRANLQQVPDFVTRFQRETLAIASLRHPNIVQYHDFSISQLPGAGNVTAYMVMDFVDGGTLAGYIHSTSRQGKVLPAVDIIRLFASIGMAVDYAHQHRREHDQLKPTDILRAKGTPSRKQRAYPTASSLVEDLAQAIRQEEKEASNIPIPVNVSQPDYSVKAMDLPTVLSTGLPSPPAGMTPSSPGISGVSFSSLPQSATTPASIGQAAAHSYTPPTPNVV